jgi:hypothetical protein
MRGNSSRLRSSLRIQLVATGAGTVVLLTVVAGWQVTGLAQRSSSDVDTLTSASLRQTSDQAITLVTTQVASVADRMQGELQVAQGAFASRGAITFGPPETWTVPPQGTGAASAVTLPRMLVGRLPLGHNADAAAPTPIVDDIAKLLGASVTVFQRVDAAGTMLRIATNVTSADGSRAIGTVIAPVGSDGTPNAVVTALLAGKTYVGNA